MPDKPTTFQLAPGFGGMRAFDLPQDALSRRNLIRAHNQQSVAHIKHRIPQQHLQQRAPLEESRGKVLQILDQPVIRLRPVHGEIEAVLVAFGGIGEVAGIGAVGNHEQLQVLEQRVVTVEALLAVAVHLVERLTDGHTTALELHLHQRQTVDQNGDVVTVGMAASLLELLDHLQLVAGQVGLVHQVNILDTTIVKHEVVDIVIVDLAGLVDDALAGPVQIGFDKTQPFTVAKLHLVQDLQLHTHVGQHGFQGIQVVQLLVTLIFQILDKLLLKIAFALVAFGNPQLLDVLVQHDEVVGFGDGFVVSHYVPSNFLYPAFLMNSATALRSAQNDSGRRPARI